MGRITKNLVKEIDKLSNRADRVSSEINQARTKKLTHWKGRRVIPVSEWRSILTSRRDEIFNYLPDDFVSGTSAGLFFEREENRDNEKKDRTAITQIEKKKKKIREWNKDYRELLTYTKSSSYGKEKCGRCLLSGADRDYDSMNIKDTIIRHLQKKVREEEEEKSNVTDSRCCSADNSDNNDDDNNNHIVARSSSPSTSSASASSSASFFEYPCTIVNRFKCPYANSTIANDDYLVMVGKIVQIIRDAIHQAHSLTSRYNDKTYYADFESGRIQIYNRYGGWQSVGKLEQELQKAKLSKVTVKTPIDVYHILTDEQTLRTVLDQYQDLNTSQEQGRREVLGNDFKELIIKFIMGIRTIFSPDELRDPVGRSLDESTRTYAYLDSESQRLFPNYYDSICHVCAERCANIQCQNCNVSICVNHWKQHGMEHHRWET